MNSELQEMLEYWYNDAKEAITRHNSAWTEEFIKVLIAEVRRLEKIKGASNE